jgi:hypothetical protein
VTVPHDGHYDRLIKLLNAGKVVPLLGAGVNSCGRPPDLEWDGVGRFLPSGTELAGYLAATFGYPPENARDLVRVSQYAVVMEGLGPLYEQLHELFVSPYEPNEVHAFLARLSVAMRERGGGQYQLIVTTNYDDSLEQAFDQAGEEYDLVSYIADGEHRGKFLHREPDGEAVVVERPNEYQGLSLTERSVILKIHGAVDRKAGDWESDSYVITEDHYIDYLTRTDISGLVPVKLASKLRRSHFLFLGYSMRDWNLRVILHRIWGQQKLNYNSWAIQDDPEPIEREFWQLRGVEILDLRLEDYVRELRTRLEAQPALEPNA